LKIPVIGTPVVVDWIDTTTYSGWQHHKAGAPVEFAPRKMSTLGFLMGSNPVGFYVVPTLSSPDAEDPREGHLDAIVLPRGCVVGIRKVLW
jgi:hypothetical protein